MHVKINGNHKYSAALKISVFKYILLSVKLNDRLKKYFF